MNLIDRNCTQGLILWIKVDEEGARLQQEINIVFDFRFDHFVGKVYAKTV